MVVVKVRSSLAASRYNAYSGFLTLDCWLVYKERSWIRRGNRAIPACVRIEWFRLAPGEPAQAFPRRRES